MLSARDLWDWQAEARGDEGTSPDRLREMVLDLIAEVQRLNALIGEMVDWRRTEEHNRMMKTLGDIDAKLDTPTEEKTDATD